MLRELTIRNFAIIDDLHIRFADGLTILSGETGAGKSIIISAVNLLLGRRASAKLIRTGASSAELEALFSITPDSSAAHAMVAQGYAPTGDLIVRRIIARAERPRIYINGRIATMQVLQSITSNLSSISGQHAHQSLLNEEEQLYILDQYGGLLKQRDAMGRKYQNILPVIEDLNTLKRRQHRQGEQVALLQFQREEIAAAAIQPQEDQLLQQEINRLKHAETLYGAVSRGIGDLYSSQGAVVERLAEVKKRLMAAGAMDSHLTRQAEQLGDIVYQVEDITANLRSYLNTIITDDQRLEEAEARLDTLNRLKRKYGGALEAIDQRFEEIERELDDMENLSTTIADTETHLGHLHQELADLAQRLSTQRSKTARALGRKVETELATLNMSKTQFQVTITQTPTNDNASSHLTANGHAIASTGIDRAAFLIAPNVGEAPKPLSAIASGGELSRVVLALKAILAQSESVETVVFDEVDAGIGGETAEVVGKKLAALARYHQIICITHLPQIAKFGDQHFKISKDVKEGRTVTSIDLLDTQERIHELARMLGGETITPATLDHAKELLGTTP